MLRVAGEPPARIRVLASEMVDAGLREALEEVAASDDEKVRKMARRP